MAERDDWLRAFVTQILHGDEEHHAWLVEAGEAYIAGQPLPEPRGGGNAALFHEAVVRACDERLGQQKHEIRELRRRLQELEGTGHA